RARAESFLRLAVMTSERCSSERTESSTRSAIDGSTYSRCSKATGSLPERMARACTGGGAVPRSLPQGLQLAVSLGPAQTKLRQVIEEGPPLHAQLVGKLRAREPRPALDHLPQELALEGRHPLGVGLVDRDRDLHRALAAEHPFFPLVDMLADGILGDGLAVGRVHRGPEHHVAERPHV